MPMTDQERLDAQIELLAMAMLYESPLTARDVEERNYVAWMNGQRAAKAAMLRAVAAELARGTEGKT